MLGLSWAFLAYLGLSWFPSGHLGANLHVTGTFITPKWLQDGGWVGLKSLKNLWKIEILAVEGHLDPKMVQDGTLAPR